MAEAAMSEARTIPVTPVGRNAGAPSPMEHQHLLKSPTNMDRLLASTQACALEPFCFFVSWQGVLTLAYRGFVPALQNLKAALDKQDWGLPSESPGSKWPKTSLGCLRDDKRLTPEDLQRLNEICRVCSMHLSSLTACITSAAVVLYACRSLERVISWHDVALKASTAVGKASQEEFQRVQAVVAEADNPDYWFSASKDGNREQHYRGNHLGATLVCVPDFAHTYQDKQDGSASLLALIENFQHRVDTWFPDMYVWFDNKSLHVTLRALT